MQARALGQLGMSASNEGRIGDAMALLSESHDIDREVGAPSEIAIDLVRFARVLAQADRAEAAVWLLARAQGLREELGIELPSDARKHFEDAEARARGDLGEAKFADAWRRGASLALEDAIAFALDSSN